MSDRFAAGLRRPGVERGDRVGLQLPNVPRFPGALQSRARDVLALDTGLCRRPVLHAVRELAAQLPDAAAGAAW